MGRKWFNIKDKKAAKEQNASRINARFGKEIYAAAKAGEPDPEGNQKLKFVLEKAKAASVPKHVIERAIEKAKGVGGEDYQELRYEGFGPDGSMIIVDALTDNVNRSAANIRADFNKNGGNMGVKGSVDYMFDNTALFIFDPQEGKTADDYMELLMDADVDIRDVVDEDGKIVVYGEPTALMAINDALREAGIESFDMSELQMVPQNEVTLTGEALETFQSIIDALEDDDDVQNVYHNVDLSAE